MQILNRLSFIILIALILRGFLMLHYHYISPDGTQYTEIGYNLIHHGAYESNGSQFPDVIQPPLYPFLSGIFTILLSKELAGKLVSLIFGLCLIWMVYRFLIYIKMNRLSAVLAAWALALHPALVSISAQAATESLFLFLTFSGVAVGWYYLISKNKTYLWLISIIWLLVYLTRPEGMVYFGMFSLVLLIDIILRKSKPTALVYLLVPFLLGSGVYIAWSTQQTGYYTISPKVKFVRAHAKLQKYFTIKEPDTPAELRHQQFKYALAPDNTQLAADAFFRKDKNMLEHYQQVRKSGTNFKKVVTGLIKVTFQNVSEVYDKLKYGLVLPPFYLVVLILGVFALPIPKQRRGLVVYILVMSAAAFAFLISHVEERFLYIFLLLAAGFMGRGMIQLKWFLVRSASLFGRVPVMLNGLTPLLILLLILNSPFLYLASDELAEKHYYYRAGKKLKQHVPSDVTVSAVKPQAIFYADLHYSVLPFASIDRLFIYLQKNNVDYLLLEEKDKKLRPMLTPIFKGNTAFRLESIFNSDGHTFYLFKI